MPARDGHGDESKGGHNIDTKNTHEKEPWAVKFRATILHDQVSKRAKALRLLEALDDSFGKLWLLCRHLALILESFEHMASSGSVITRAGVDIFSARYSAKAAGQLSCGHGGSNT